MSEKWAEIWARLREQLMADKKKSAALGALLAILLVVVGVRLFSNAAPDATEAAPPVVAQPAATEPQLIRPTTVALPAASIKDDESSELSSKSGGPSDRLYVEGSARQAVHTEGMSRKPVRDVFTTPAWAQFPLAILPETQKPPSVRSDKGDSGFWSTIGKRLVEQQEERNRMLETIEQELTELALHSTLTGPTPLAHISGRLVRPGDSIHGFSVVRIEDRRVLLEKSGIHRVLRMP